jgi:YegS/Rv2252/BmrU family lipid kinase
MKKGYLLVNPISGRFHSRHLINLAAKMFRDKGWDLNVIETLNRTQTAEVAKDAVKKGHDAIFVAGGDGTVRDAILPLINSKTALGVLPKGTSNVLLKEIGFSNIRRSQLLGLTKMVNSLSQSDIRPIDVGMCNGWPFILWVGIGLDALISRSMEKKRIRTRIFPELNYFFQVLYQSKQWQGFKMKIKVDDSIIEYHDHKEQILFAVVNNIRHYAGGYVKLSEDIAIDDGKMDLWLFFGRGVFDAMRYIWKMLHGDHGNYDSVKRFGFTKLKLESESHLNIHLDGDPMPLCKSIEIKILKRALLLLSPRVHS